MPSLDLIDMHMHGSTSGDEICLIAHYEIDSTRLSLGNYLYYNEPDKLLPVFVWRHCRDIVLPLAWLVVCSLQFVEGRVDEQRN